MDRTVMVPEIFENKVVAFFTGRKVGADNLQLSGIPLIADRKIYMPIQKHTDKVLILDSDLERKLADAVITKRKDVIIGVQTADCVPILLYDTKARAIGAVHAGWRGTAARILRETIKAMGDRFGSSASNILVAIGPSIKGCCYNVGYEVIEAVEIATGNGEYWTEKGEKYFIDLPSVNKQQAVSSGIPPENVWISDDCTFCLSDKYYSYRHAKGPTGRQGGFIGIL
jgi:YfiH family protein